jgi:integrase
MNHDISVLAGEDYAESTGTTYTEIPVQRGQQAMMPAIPGQGVSFSAAQLPVAIDYPAALALRQMALVQDELPKYLLAPEVSALLHYVPDLHRKMLLATLWNTGARINEALALTRSDFSLAPPYPFVQLATLKQRTEKATRTAGRAPAGSLPHRIVPLSDPQYARQLEMMVATLKIPLERRNKRTGRTEKARIWEITDRTVRTWINEAVDAAAADGVTFSVPVPRTRSVTATGCTCCMPAFR